MLTIINLLLLFLFAIPLYILSKLFSKPSIPKGLKRIDGPNGWPLVGNLLTVKEPLWSFLYKISEKYGPLFKFRMGCRDIIVISSYKILSKTLKEKGVNFSGRWKNILVQTIIRNSGILQSDGEWWATQRSFALKVLRDFGFGKQRSTEIISNECSILIKELEENSGKTISARFLFPKYTVNVIAKLVMNMRFERESKSFTFMTSMIERIAQNTNFVITILLMYPILEDFPRFSKFLLWLTGRLHEFDVMHKFIMDIIDEHKKRFNFENEGEDFIDMFLKEKYKLDNENVQNHTFIDWQLVRVVFELFVAGYETTSTTLTWSMLFMAKHPEIQEKAHTEIINAVGLDRIPDLGDKKALPYTQAVMDEIFRLSSVVPLSLTHRVYENTEIEGIFIPKNSIVFPNLYACHRDKDVWEKPFEFYPEHFLTNLDNGDLKYTPKDELVPFSIGKRQCLGEGLARMEFFIFFTGILQKFKVKFDSEMNSEKYTKITSGTDGIIRAPFSSDVVFEMR